MAPTMRSMRALTLAALLSFSCGTSDSTIGSPSDDTSTGSFRLSERVARLDASKYGVNSHGGPADMLATFASINLRWHRVDAEWSQVERVEGTYDWALQDDVIASAERLNLHLMATLSYTPSWASGTNDPAAPPRDPSKFVRFVREFTRRYRGKFGCVGVWNEPNLRQFWAGGKSQFINSILVPSLQAIREEAPEQAICGPDLSSSGNERTDWMEPILASPAGALFDIITHHQYDGNDTVSGRVQEIDRMRELLVRKGQGDKPLWITEIGWSNQQQAVQHLPGVMAAMNQRPWWGKTFWYDSHGGGWGLLGPDGAPNRGQPQASFFTYRDVIAASAPPPPPPPPPPAQPQPQPPPSGAWVLTANGSLAAGQQLVSQDGRLVLVYQGDGNLVLYKGGTPTWSTATHGTAAGTVYLQGDGNFVVYEASGRPVWNSGTHGNEGAWLVLQNDGNLVIYSAANAPLWSSGTAE